MDRIKETKQLCKSYSLTFEDKGNGHIIISGKGARVNYYPNSKNRTVYVEGGGTTKYCDPYDAIRLCLTNGKGGLKPKHITKNKPQVELNAIHTNPASIKNFYNGKVPPWEFDDFIICQSDQLRIDAYRLQCEAELMETEQPE